jgi:hypothetical protein
MKLPASIRHSLPIMTLVLCCSPVAAQHPGAAKGTNGHPSQHASPPVGGSGGVAHFVGPSTAAHSQAMYQMYQVWQQDLSRDRARNQQAHSQQMQQFKAWSGNSPSAAGLPVSAQGFKYWVETQRHNKALGVTYDPRYDQYREFVKSKKPGKSQTAQAQKSSQSPTTDSSGTPTQAAQAQAKPTQTGQTQTATIQSKSQTAADDHKGKATVDSHASADHMKHHGLAHEPPIRGVGRGTASGVGSDQTAIGLLRTAHSQLHQVHNDLLGERKKALHHITMALHLLGSHIADDSGGATSFTATPDATYRKVVHEVIGELRRAEGHLTEGRHQQARHQVATAIHELHVALNGYTPMTPY